MAIKYNFERTSNLKNIFVLSCDIFEKFWGAVDKHRAIYKFNDRKKIEELIPSLLMIKKILYLSVNGKEEVLDYMMKEHEWFREITRYTAKESLIYTKIGEGDEIGFQLHYYDNAGLEHRVVFDTNQIQEIDNEINQIFDDRNVYDNTEILLNKVINFHEKYAISGIIKQSKKINSSVKI